MSAFPVDLPALSQEYSLSSDQIMRFHEDGHILLREVVSAREIAAYRPHLLETIARHQEENQAVEKLVSGKQHKWIYISNLWHTDDVARQFILASRFGKLAADLLGVDRVRLFRDQVYFKEPGGENTAWHQDGHFMPIHTDKIITMWLPLVDVTPDMAPMSFLSGTHRPFKFLGTSTPQDEKMQQFAQSMVEQGYRLINYGTLAAGDVTFHSGWTLHSAPANRSLRTREVLVVVYYADGVRIAPLRKLGADARPQERYVERMRRETLTTCFPGLKPGDTAVSAMNPVVYQRPV